MLTFVCPPARYYSYSLHKNPRPACSLADATERYLTPNSAVPFFSSSPFAALSNEDALKQFRVGKKYEDNPQIQAKFLDTVGVRNMCNAKHLHVVTSRISGSEARRAESPAEPAIRQGNEDECPRVDSALAKTPLRRVIHPAV